MRRALIGTVAASATLLCAVTGAGAATTPGTKTTKTKTPTAAQIRKAVAGAERSGYLWATVNVCVRTGKGKGGVMGVRGEMPALGFSSTLSISVSLNEYSTTLQRFTPLTGATATRPVTLGTFSTRIHQGGAEFPFSADPGLLDASVTFTWTRGATQIAQVTRTTTAGHPQAAFGRPEHYSAAQCKL